MARPDEIISASEIGQWTYCNRAWFLARAGEVNTIQNMIIIPVHTSLLFSRLCDWCYH